MAFIYLIHVQHNKNGKDDVMKKHHNKRKENESELIVFVLTAGPLYQDLVSGISCLKDKDK